MGNDNFRFKRQIYKIYIEETKDTRQFASINISNNDYNYFTPFTEFLKKFEGKKLQPLLPWQTLLCNSLTMSFLTWIIQLHTLMK
jgi:hypothetical protein